MAVVGETINAIRSVLLLQEDVRQLKEMAASQGGRLSALAEAHGNLRDRVSRLEGLIEGAAVATRNQRRIEE